MSAATGLARVPKIVGDGLESHWTKLPNSFFVLLPKFLKPLEADVLRTLWHLSAGGIGRPEWISITEKKMAEEFCFASVPGVRKAFDELEKKALIEKQDRGKGKGRGRGQAYRILRPNLNDAHLSEFGARVLRRVDRSTTKLSPSTKMPILPGKRRSFELPVPIDSFAVTNRTKIALNAETNGGELELTTITDSAGTEIEAPDRKTNNAGSQFAQLAAILDPILVPRFSARLDEDLGRRILNALRPMPIEDFGQWLTTKLHGRTGEIKSAALFVEFAKEARDERKPKRTEQNKKRRPEPSQPLMNDESEALTATAAAHSAMPPPVARVANGLQSVEDLLASTCSRNREESRARNRSEKHVGKRWNIPRTRQKARFSGYE